MLVPADAGLIGKEDSLTTYYSIGYEFLHLEELLWLDSLVLVTNLLYSIHHLLSDGSLS